MENYEQFKKQLESYDNFDIKALNDLYSKYGKEKTNLYFDLYYDSLNDNNLLDFIEKYNVYFNSKFNTIQKKYIDEMNNDIVRSLIINAAKYPILTKKEEQYYAFNLDKGKKELFIINNSNSLDEGYKMYPSLNIEIILLSIKKMEDYKYLKEIKQIPYIMEEDGIFKNEIKVITKYLDKFSDNVPTLEQLKDTFPFLSFDNKNGIDINLLASQIDLLKKYIIAKRELVIRNLRMSIYVAKKYQNKISMEDFIQIGYFGLVKAVNRFDINKEVRFSTYAFEWIRSLIGRYCIDKSYMIRKPSKLAIEIKKYEQFIYNYMARYGIEPSIGEIATNLNFSEDKIKKIQYYANDVISLEININDDEDYELIDFIKDENAEFEDNVIKNEIIKKAMIIIDANLTDKEKKVVYNRFGINSEAKSYTLEEVGSMLNLTRERIRQIEASALKKVKKYVKKIY